jgi:hypothetical protein
MNAPGHQNTPGLEADENALAEIAVIFNQFLTQALQH